jgi:hypothetical protein
LLQLEFLLYTVDPDFFLLRLFMKMLKESERTQEGGRERERREEKERREEGREASE